MYDARFVSKHFATEQRMTLKLQTVTDGSEKLVVAPPTGRRCQIGRFCGTEMCGDSDAAGSYDIQERRISESSDGARSRQHPA